MTAKDDFNKQVQEYLRIAFEGKWVILAIFVVVVTATWFYTMQQDDIYQSSATVRLKASKDLLSGQASQPGFDILGWGGERIIANEILIISSDAVAEHVAALLMDRLDLTAARDTLPILKATPRPSTLRKIARTLSLEGFFVSVGLAKLDTSTRLADQEIVAARARAQMTAEEVRGVDFIRISVQSTSPVEAATIANLYVDAYQRRNLESARENVTTARSFLEGQLDSKKDSLANIENMVRGFQQSQGFVSLDAETQQLIQQLATFEAQLEQAKIDLAAAEKIRSEMHDQLKSVEPNLARQLKEGVDPQLKALLDRKTQYEAEIQTAEFNRKQSLRIRPDLEPYHAKEIAEKQRKLREVLDLIDEASKNLTDSDNLTGTPVEYARELRQKIMQQDIDIESQRSRIANLRAVIQEYNVQFEKIPSQTIQYARLERRRLSYDKLYGLLDEKYQEAMINEQTTMGNVDIVDRARVPNRPVKPNRPMNMILGILVGLGLGFGVAIVLRYLDTTIRSPEDVEKLGMPVLSFIPTFGAADNQLDRNQTLVTLTAPQSPPSESYRTMRTAIENSLPDHGKSKAVVFSSPAPKEGKSTAIANLAVSAANSGRKVLLVDADLRRPVQHQIFDVDREPGLSNALIGEVPVNQCIKKTAVPGLHIVPCGNIPSHPAELLGSARMEKFVKLVRQYYDLVLFDAPPVIAMADTLVLAKYTDGSVLIVSADQTKTLGLEKSREMLESNNARILGVVVNRFNANKVYYSYYRYYYQNYYYYSADGEKKQRRVKKKAGASAPPEIEKAG
ncbi:MAG: polysaccharide biosynthesis tyrosine autokinase [Bacteroidota bacterium]|jgi:tyrosine-protein kinase Etk/Wzc|nr:polysaccharide biosynthesis tyrosine autokinase [Bacteroidota bacterium]